MEKKLFEPIRRGAPSLPFDFTEALKEIETENEDIENINKLKEEIENINKIMKEYNQKMIEITGIPKERLERLNYE